MKKPLLLVIRGWLCVSFAPLVEVLAFIESGKVKALAQPDIKQRFAEQGSDPSGTTIAEFKQFIAGELDKWARIVKISSAKVE